MTATASRTRKYIPTCQRDRKAVVLCWSPITGVGCVRVTSEGKDERYHLAELAHDFPGRCFHVKKDGSEEESNYDVNVNGKQSHCDCRGNARWGHCVHVEFLSALIAAGKL